MARRSNCVSCFSGFAGRGDVGNSASSARAPRSAGPFSFAKAKRPRPSRIRRAARPRMPLVPQPQLAESRQLTNDALCQLQSFWQSRFAQSFKVSLKILRPAEKDRIANAGRGNSRCNFQDASKGVARLV